MFVRNHNTYILVFPLELFIKSIVCWLYSLFWILIWSPSNAVQWGLCYWFCICVHCHFSVGFVLLILDLCSLPVFSGVCVIDSVSVFTSSFQWGLCYWFCICVHCQFSVGFVSFILFNDMSLHVLFHVVMSAMLFVFIYVYWSPARFLYQMMFVLFNSNRWVYQC